MSEIYRPPAELVLGTRLNKRVPRADQERQRAEADEILRRLRTQPGVILADEVGMGKTFVALAVAYSVAIRSSRRPVIVMVPANLIDKWEQDLRTFCELYLDGRRAVHRDQVAGRELLDAAAVRYGVARDSVELLKLLDDRPRERCHIAFLAQGAMSRRQTDKWVRLALIATALKRHGTGKATRLIKVKAQIHRFLAELLRALGEERASDFGEDLWNELLRCDPKRWKRVYNGALHRERRALKDDPVPSAVVGALRRVRLRAVADALRQMPVHDRRNRRRHRERIQDARWALREAEQELWKELLAKSRWRSSLLVMDEAHHLKNPGTRLARQLQSQDSDDDLRTGDGAMAKAFDRMLFLTATPFQLGHRELVNVLKRFGDVRWDSSDLGRQEQFTEAMEQLGGILDESQRSAVALRKAWARLRSEDCGADKEVWWKSIRRVRRDALNYRQRAVVDAFETAKRRRDIAEGALRPWVVRHNKGRRWPGTAIARRIRRDGSAIVDNAKEAGLPIPPVQLLPFFLAARSAVTPSQDVLGEALSSSYEAFRFTRKTRAAARDEQDEPNGAVDLSNRRWYLAEFDQALEQYTGAMHPKVTATVQRVADLWESGEKVLVFAFYRYTCRALRIHIGTEIERRMILTGQKRLRRSGRNTSQGELRRLLGRIQTRFFDDSDSPGRRALDAALQDIVSARSRSFRVAKVSREQQRTVVDIMRRFLRVDSTLVRCFPLAELDTEKPANAVASTLEHTDASNVSWRQKFDGFIEFLTHGCATDERQLYLEAAHITRTGRIRVETDEDEDGAGGTRVVLANVQVATGTTRRPARARLMRAFNTPFFPDVLVCSEVMGEGVDLQRFCRHVIHHDLAWNPSTIEQRTGRIDRLGCKAEGKQPIIVYIPFLAGAADDRQYQVMTDRERWFRVVMGQDEVARLITPDSSSAIPLPDGAAAELSFELGLEHV